MNPSDIPTPTDFAISTKPLGSQGFSLVELLAVVSLILLITGLSVFTLFGQNSGRMSDSILQITGLLEQGRQFAIAQRTYVWVAFHEPENSQDTLLVTLLAASDGVNSVPWNAFSTNDVPSTNLVPISKVFQFEHVRISNAGEFSAAEIPRLTDEPAAESAIHSLPVDSPAFRIRHRDEAVVFHRALQFTPSGHIRIGSSPVDFVELGVQALQGDRPDANNLALIRMNGLTGTSRVFRR